MTMAAFDFFGLFESSLEIIRNCRTYGALDVEDQCGPCIFSQAEGRTLAGNEECKPDQEENPGQGSDVVCMV